MGSAQRRRKGAILQHGSLLLSASPTTPELFGVRELSTAPTYPRYWSDLVSRQIPESLGLGSDREQDATFLLPRSDVLERSVYRAEGWTRRR